MDLAASRWVWQVRGVRWLAWLASIPRAVRSIALAGLVATGCDRSPSPAEIADRAWRAHELVVTAGERAATCADAGVAMQRVFAEHRAQFVAAMALDRDPRRLAEATSYLEVHQGRYADLETRMTGLSERCAEDLAVQAVFSQMESP
jgi:hypothetical protein